MRVSLAKAVVGAVVALAAGFLVACGGGPQYIQISAGHEHTCGLRSDGTVACWGKDDFGQVRVPENERFTAVAAGGIYTCGLRVDKTALCWGHARGLSEEDARLFLMDGFFDIPFPPEGERFESIMAMNNATCGLLADGSVTCWHFRWGESSPLGTERVVELVAGLDDGICGFRKDGSVICSYPDTQTLPQGEQFIAISSSNIHSCGLRSDGSVHCWGFDLGGQLSPPEDTKFSAIAAGTLHTCGLRSDGSAVCWGYDLDRRSEEPKEYLADARWIELPKGERFTEISAGYSHTCGLKKDGGVSCWGYDSHGEASPPDAIE